MAQRTKSAFKSTKNSRYADNTSGSITAANSRDMHEDVADSALFIEDNAYSSFVVTASGTDTYTATLSPAITAYTTGAIYRVLVTNANTGPATMNFNGVAAKSIVKNGSAALVSGDIPANSYQQLMYDGTNLQLLGRVGSTGSSDLQSTTVAVSSSEILNLNTTPKTLIAAPGAGKYIHVLYGHVFLDYGGTAYSNETTEIEYATGQDIIGSITTFLNVAFDNIRSFSATTGGTYAFSQVENSLVRYRATSANPTTGNGTISINLIYRIVTI